MSDRLVNVYAETTEGWKLVFENISEDQALEIWKAGFATGHNKFSIETEESKRIAEHNRKMLLGLKARK